MTKFNLDAGTKSGGSITAPREPMPACLSCGGSGKTDSEKDAGPCPFCGGTGRVEIPAVYIRLGKR